MVSTSCAKWSLSALAFHLLTVHAGHGSTTAGTREHTVGDDGVADGEDAEELANDVGARLVAPGPAQQPLVVEVEGRRAPLMRGRGVPRHRHGRPVAARGRALDLGDPRPITHPRDGALEELHLVARQCACTQPGLSVHFNLLNKNHAENETAP